MEMHSPTNEQIQAIKQQRAILKGQKIANNAHPTNPYTSDDDMIWDDVDPTYKKIVPLESYLPVTEIYKKVFKEIPKQMKKIKCSCCGKDSFNNADKTLSLLHAANRSRSSFFYKSFCSDCSAKLLEHYFEEEKDEVTAMRKWCCETNTFWDAPTYEKARVHYLKSDREHMLHYYYMKEVDVTKGFYDSDFIQSQEAKVVEICSTLNEDSILNEEAEYLGAKRRILKLYRYDPFEFKSEEAKKLLYIRLDNMITPEMENDSIKLQVAVEIVGYLEELADCGREIDYLKALDAEQRKKIEAGETLTPVNYIEQIMELTKLRKDVNSILANQAKAYGFDNSSRGGVTKGKGTLTWVLNHMEADRYEPSLANYRDVKWSPKFTEIAEISAAAMMSELRINDDDLFDQVKKTQKKMRELSREKSLLQEELRKAWLLIEEYNIVEKAKRQGLRIDDEGLITTYEAEKEFLD